MKVSVEMSYYPLRPEFASPILDFIKRLNTYKELTVKTNGMSTQVFGDYFEVMKILTDEMYQSFALPHSVFVMKIVNADLKN